MATWVGIKTLVNEIERLTKEREKLKLALATLYYDSSYSSRSAHVNAFLDDPEIQGWIREKG